MHKIVQHILETVPAPFLNHSATYNDDHPAVSHVWALEPRVNHCRLQAM